MNAPAFGGLGVEDGIIQGIERTTISAMVVEDHPTQRMAAVALLRGLVGGAVLEASEGAVALERLRAHGAVVDLVLCDLRMDGMDGIEFIRHLARGQLCRQVALCSALSSELLDSVESMARAEGLGVPGRLGKPVQRSALADLIGRLPYQPAEVAETRFDVVAQRPVHAIREALERGEFEPFFQARVALATGRTEGVEALARWRHPRDGIISPAAFIPAMEAAGLLPVLTARMVEAGLAALRQWLDEGRDLSLAVNFTAAAMRETDLPVRLLERVKAHGVAPERFTLEITESAVVGDVAATLETMSRLRMYGFGLSIDDIGTGYSSMAQLSQLPFTELKVDRHFVSGLDRSVKNREIVQSVIEMGTRLGLKATAEGAETHEEIEALRRLGCDSVQGFYYGRPAPFADFALNPGPSGRGMG